MIGESLACNDRVGTVVLLCNGIESSQCSAATLLDTLRPQAGTTWRTVRVGAALSPSSATGVMLAEILAQLKVEIGSLIQALFVAESPAESRESGPAEFQFGYVSGFVRPR